MDSMMLFGFVFVFMMVFAVIRFFAEQKREQAIEAVCNEHGFQFDSSRNKNLPRQNRHIDLFKKGRDRYAKNVISGRYGDLPFRVFDYHYATQSTGADGSTDTHHHWHLCLTAVLPKRFPTLRVRQEGIFDKLVAAVGFDDIDFESYQFSKTYHVTSTDKRFAYDFFHTRMQEYFLKTSISAMALEENTMMFYQSGTLKPETLISKLDMLKDVYKQIPNTLLKG